LDDTLSYPEFLDKNDNLIHNNTMNHDQSGITSARPRKMGEGGNGSSHCPLPKVLVRSKEDLQKLSMNQEKAINCEQSVPFPVLTASSKSLAQVHFDKARKSNTRVPLKLNLKASTLPSQMFSSHDFQVAYKNY